ncbi:SDR family NAD(P)-dependent oxidoreductase [Chitinophaga oryzae]|uniref:SDR family NAD(P)-dependent oxidoreductase n=1 Tax=Chitinophaga oryzae TaxID=2725414 RepID=A0AAE7D6Z1_9BACT|nr:SDR family NAD(P)-dependent oxidoreductase [Chitinophaga oryzae]QJB31681.1 SDR family NAD(P)-dependent oxidoreductase [Chitinophaga oryzae]
MKQVLILGANSNVAKEALKMYVGRGYHVVAASRSTAALETFVLQQQLPLEQVTIRHFNATDFSSHRKFYDTLPAKPQIVLYAAGYLKDNTAAMQDWDGSFNMMQVHYCGAVSILNIIVTDSSNTSLERIIGLSSLSGVRGRKSNFIYGSTKAAFTQYLAGLRQHLFAQRITVNVIVAGYIRSKMTAGLPLPEPLMLEPAFIAGAVVNAGKRFTIVPGFKWKMIYQVLRLMPERLVARLP